jgi:hypothetical protein
MGKRVRVNLTCRKTANQVDRRMGSVGCSREIRGDAPTQATNISNTRKIAQAVMILMLHLPAKLLISGHFGVPEPLDDL